MMTDRRQALIELRDKVRAGEFDGSPGGEFRPRFNAFMNIAEAAFGVYGPAGLPELAWRSYNNGSLDAAKALHEAVLGGAWLLPAWVPSRIAGKDVVTVEIYSADFDGPEECIAEGDNPARAWLLAILEALIAQKDTPQ